MGIPLLSEAHDHLHWAVEEENHSQIEAEEEEVVQAVVGLLIQDVKVPVVVLGDPRQTMK